LAAVVLVKQVILTPTMAAMVTLLLLVQLLQQVAVVAAVSESFLGKRRKRME
jgi:hypothetical protein